MREEGTYVLNYLALLGCIIGGCPPEKAIRLITLQDPSADTKYIKRIENGKRMGSTRKQATKVIDIQTGEEFVFESGVKCCQYLGITRGTDANYIKHNKIYKNKYRFERV